MNTQSKPASKRASSQDREFEQLLRRAALYAKGQVSRNVRLSGRKRSKAA